jgi:membrane protein
MDVTTQEHERGRAAKRPQHIPLKGWYDVLVRTFKELSSDNLSLVAAGVAFYALLSIFPTLAASISLYTFIENPIDIEVQFEGLAVLIPSEARPILLEQVHTLVNSSDKSLGITFFLSMFFALFSAMKGMNAIIMALNIVYNESEKRSFLLVYLYSFILTVASVVCMVLMLALVVVVPVILNFVNLSGLLAGVFSILRWPLLLVFISPILAALYHFAPSRERPKWRWVNWGAILATVLWLIASLGFSMYVENFGTYNKVYGSLGALVVLLMWFYISAYALLFGAEFSAEMEHQTKVDSTVGISQPLGERNAYVADTIGKRQ